MYSSEELKKLARIAGYTDDDALLLSKEKRFSAIRGRTDSKSQRTAAAIELQRLWRGYIVRSNWLNIVNSHANHHWKNDPHIDNSTLLSNNGATSVFPSASSSFQMSSRIASSKAYKSYAEIYQTNMPRPFIEFCCTIIQRWWRLILAKRRHRNYMLVAADYAEQFGFKMWKLSDFHKLDRAARIIQRAWRRHVDTQVFKYYKEFVCTKCECNPAHFLKSINPKESQLFDPASGLFIRFRLGGETFPPSVYYKVFTTRNIADVGAFAPRNYTEPFLKILPMKYLHNKSDLKSSENSVDCNVGWYERMDNNGWRLVSDKVLGRLYHDHISYSSSKKKSKFHHSKLLRKSACEKARKQRKISWMKKMYRDGAANMDNDRIQTLVDSTAKGMIAASEIGYELSVEDWEVDELLMWTNALNFDQ